MKNAVNTRSCFKKTSLHIMATTLSAFLLSSTAYSLSAKQLRGQDMKVNPEMAHVNPMPNLMTIMVKHSDALGLSAAQRQGCNQWRDQKRAKGIAMSQGIVQKETKLMQMALADKDRDILLAKIDVMLAERKALAVQKMNCQHVMRSSLKPAQYQKVIALYRDKLKAQKKNAPKGQMAKMRNVLHVNPMPNLIQIVMTKSAILKLKPEQKKHAMAWRKANNAKSQGMIKSILQQEAALMQSALAGKPKAELVKQLDAMLATRRDMAEGKIDCRDYLRTAFDKTQYSTLRTLYAAQDKKMRTMMMPAKHSAVHDGHEIQISDAWARKTLVKGGNSAAFMTFTNTGKKDNELVSASADISQRVELHTHIKKENGVMQMRKLEGGIPLKAGAQTLLKRGGLHIMFIKMTRDLKEGDTFKLTLKFKHGKDKVLTVPAKMTMKKGMMHGKMMHH